MWNYVIIFVSHTDPDSGANYCENAAQFFAYICYKQSATKPFEVRLKPKFYTDENYYIF